MSRPLRGRAARSVSAEGLSAPSPSTDLTERVHEIAARAELRILACAPVAWAERSDHAGEADPGEAVMVIFAGTPPAAGRRSTDPLRRSTTTRVGDALVDVARHRVVLGRSIRALTPREGDVLLVLLEARGRVVSREELLTAAWPEGVSRGAVDTAVHRLRRKLEADPSRPRWLVSVRGRGFRLEV